MILIKYFCLLLTVFFLKIKLNCDKENMIVLNTCSFQKKMLSNLTCVLIYLLTECIFEDGFKDSCAMKIV